MVLSLVESALLSIAKAIKDGTIQHPQLLPPNLRQQVLNTVLKRDLINDPNCMALLSSVDFLDGMESFGTEPGNYELEFLHRLDESLATVLPNGETVGAGIRKLNLSVYWYDCSPVTRTSFPLVSQLIGQCPNTTSLSLRGIMSPMGFPLDYHSRLFPSVLNDINACTGVMENLVELSLRDMKKVLITDHPIINFNRLSTLKLDYCFIQGDSWPEFLLNVPTLENLHMIGVKFVGTGLYDNETRHPIANGLDRILPFSMPQLKSLEIVSIEDYQSIFRCNKAFVDNLIGCPEIHRVQLSLDQKSTDDESLERLANMNIDLTVKARFTVDHENEDIRPALDSSSKFNVVRIFHERMNSLELNVCDGEWSPELSTALEDVIDSCSNLTTFGLHLPHKSDLSDAVEIDPVEMEPINEAMIQFFGNQERALHLKELHLIGNFNEAVILSIFESCLNLDRLVISCCMAIRDQHLIDWVSNGGGKLKRLAMLDCPNITSEGIIPILATSAEGLLEISAYLDEADGEGRNWETVLPNLCPNAEDYY